MVHVLYSVLTLLLSARTQLSELHESLSQKFLSIFRFLRGDVGVVFVFILGVFELIITCHRKTHCP